MKNVSGNANWFAPEIEKEKKEEILIDDDRVVLSYCISDVSYFLASDGRPIVFKDEAAGQEYITKNDLENYEIDRFQDYDFSDIELVEL